MKKLLAAAMLVGGAVSTQTVAATCLQTRDIVNAHSEDGKTMEFQMRNGQTYINHLQGSCPDLKFNGFAWTVRGIEQVCENMQSLRVLNSGQICVLGKFDAPGSRSPG
jgi:hypothetical protein